MCVFVLGLCWRQLVYKTNTRHWRLCFLSSGRSGLSTGNSQGIGRQNTVLLTFVYIYCACVYIYRYIHIYMCVYIYTRRLVTPFCFVSFSLSSPSNLRDPNEWIHMKDPLDRVSYLLCCTVDDLTLFFFDSFDSFILFFLLFIFAFFCSFVEFFWWFFVSSSGVFDQWHTPCRQRLAFVSNGGFLGAVRLRRFARWLSQQASYHSLKSLQRNTKVVQLEFISTLFFEVPSN